MGLRVCPCKLSLTQLCQLHCSDHPSSLKSSSASSMKMLWLSSLMLMASVAAYPSGPPEKACMKMFPTNHNSTAMTSKPPYELTVSDGVINGSNHVFQVTLTTTGDSDYPYFEGMFVQARLASCYNDLPVGTFTIDSNDNFTRLMDCSKGRPNSAVSHNESIHMTMATFNWTSPMSVPGHIFFRATVVKNITTFWTKVVSRIIEDITHPGEVPTKVECDICYSKESCTASSIVAILSLVVAGVAIALAWM